MKCPNCEQEVQGVDDHKAQDPWICGILARMNWLIGSEATSYQAWQLEEQSARFYAQNWQKERELRIRTENQLAEVAQRLDKAEAAKDKAISRYKELEEDLTKKEQEDAKPKSLHALQPRVETTQD